MGLKKLGFFNTKVESITLSATYQLIYEILEFAF